jgi:hypothetical protein
MMPAENGAIKKMVPHYDIVTPHLLGKIAIYYYVLFFEISYFNITPNTM